MERLHKMVNGVRVDLSEEEEAATRADWEKNRLELNEKRLEKKAKAEEKELAKAALAKKLGIEQSELELLMGK